MHMMVDLVMNGEEKKRDYGFKFFYQQKLIILIINIY